MLVLTRDYPLGLGPDAIQYLDPRVEHDYSSLPPEYRYHIGNEGWAVVPRTAVGAELDET